MAFTPEDYLNGILAIIWVSISVTVGLIIASRYRKYKENALLYVGIAWIGISNGWYPTCISFILSFFNNGIGLSANPEIYFIIGIPWMGFTLSLWLYAITELIIEKKQKLITLIYLTVAIAYAIYFFIVVFYDSMQIAILQTPVDAKYNGITSIYSIIVLGSVLVSGLIFSYELIKSKESEKTIRGICLLICFIAYGIGSISDAVAPLNIITLPIIRLLLISSAIMMYFGWFLPDSIKKRLSK